MKKTYIKPLTKCYDIKVEQSILAGSYSMIIDDTDAAVLDKDDDIG
ncbi:MAG: hypothetical protein HUK08_05390 [Bacteroidaceae bacterium]|nr:hypothetical protein [Bacteroidaceae bacterium]